MKIYDRMAALQPIDGSYIMRKDAMRVAADADFRIDVLEEEIKRLRDAISNARDSLADVDKSLREAAGD